MSMDHPPEQPLRVTIQDLRAARYCLAGVRPWFRRHGLDWQDFLAHGIAAEQLRATGDGLVEPVIATAQARRAAEAKGAADRSRGAQAAGGAEPRPREPSHGR